MPDRPPPAPAPSTVPGLRRIGLTGGIGSGKSTVAAHLRTLGATVLDLDAFSRAALTDDEQAIAATLERFGDDILTADGTIDRRALGAVVFADPVARTDLERIVLARVAAAVTAAEADVARRGERVVVHDSPLLFEQRTDGDYAHVIAVLAPRSARLERLLASRDRTREHFELVMRNQVTDLERIRRAGTLILNNADRDALARRTERAWERVCTAGTGTAPGATSSVAAAE